MNENQQWYYTDSNGQQAGPVSLNELKTLIAQSAVSTSSMVWTEGMENWKTVGEIDALTPAPSPVVPQPTAVNPSPPAAPTTAAVENLYAPPTAQPSFEDVMNPYAQVEYGGIRRLNFFLKNILCFLILFVLAMIGVSIEYWVFIVLAVIAFIVFYVRICVQRLNNMGASGWWVLLILVPIANSILQIVLLSCPEGYKDHKKMDTGGIIVAVILIVLNLLSLGLNLAGVFNTY